MEKLKCKIVMIPTDKKTHLGIINNELKIYFSGREKSSINQPQELYFVSVNKLSNNDLALLDWEGKGDLNDYRIGKVISNSDIYIEMFNQYNNVSKCELSRFPNAKWYKIEATTDQSLNLPLIGGAFLDKYVKSQGKIEEVLLEQNHPHDDMILDINNATFTLTVKVRKDKTVIISPVKNLWNTEEVIQLLSKFGGFMDDRSDEYYLQEAKQFIQEQGY